MDDAKKSFAERLTARLVEFYQGKLPSNNRIARDFTLRAPNLPPISHETIRQWLRGDCLPHVSRLHVLTKWLGKDLICFNVSHIKTCPHHEQSRACQFENQHLCDALSQLMPAELQTLDHLIQLLIDRRRTDD